MKTFGFLSLVCGLVASLQASLPSTLNYQGRVLQNGQPFEGTGHFVFGIYEGSTLLWTNKLPVPSPLNDPAAAIDSSDAKALTVRNGVFNVRLGEGDANNAPVGTDVFFKFDGTQRVRTDVKLAVWFSPAAEGPYTRLDPDITFASVPFAQVAGVAETVKDGSVSATQIALGAVTTDKLALGAVTTDKLEDGAVDDSKLADGSVTLSKIEPGWGTVPPGTVIVYGIPGTALPDGYLECDGSAVAAATYPRLAALLGEGGSSAFGAVGAGLVKLPDFRGRIPMGRGQGSGLSDRAFATNLGAETHTLTIEEIPNHDHGGLTQDEPKPSDQASRSWHIQRSTSYRSGLANGVTSSPFDYGHTWEIPFGSHQHKIPAQGGGAPHNIIQPSLVVRYLIKY